MLFVHACLPALLEKKRQPNWNLLWRFSCQNWMLCCKSHLRCVSLFLRKVRDDMTIEDIMKAKWLVPPPTVGTGPSSWGILAGSPPGWGRMLPAGCLECWGSHETHSPCCGNTHASRQPLWFCWRHWQLEGKYDVIYIVTPQRTTHKAVPTSFECVLLEFEKKMQIFCLATERVLEALFILCWVSKWTNLNYAGATVFVWFPPKCMFFLYQGKLRPPLGPLCRVIMVEASQPVGSECVSTYSGGLASARLFIGWQWS